jgi:hypothetical protein
VNFFDVDHDGDEDLYISTSDYLWLNDGDGTFTEVPNGGGIATFSSHGCMTNDYDHDGDLDLGIINHNGSLNLFRNDTFPIGKWVQIRLRGVLSNRDAVGTIVTAESGALDMKRQVKGGHSLHSEDDHVVHFGLGANAFVQVLKIYWPSGLVDSLGGIAANQFITVVEGSTLGTTGVGGAQPVPARVLSSRPNPFTHSTRIEYSASRAIEMSLTIYDIAGARVKTLADGPHEAGTFSARWDGTDARGRDVAAGHYYYQLRGPGLVESGKLTLLR